MDRIQYKSIITLENVPIKWLSRIEFFYPDLPGFPIMYVHVLLQSNRIYGFPVAINKIIYVNDELCNIDILFLSNKDLDSDNFFKESIKNELSNRVGLADPISKDIILSSCKEERFKPFFSQLWDISAKLYGNILPYGIFFEGLFSIVRFVSAFQPKTGRQSEMRMLYNFMHTFGEEIEINEETLPEWCFLQFLLIPTYKELLSKTFSDFPKFKRLYDSSKKVWNLKFIKTIQIETTSFNCLEEAWPPKKEDFINMLLKGNDLNDDDIYQMSLLTDAFNRLSWRASFFIWSIFTALNKDYTTWDKTFFSKFYTSEEKITGCSPKVVACFLQQGFKKQDIIPLDIWINTFKDFALGTESIEEFFNLFDNLGKIERLIWLTSQANKVNIRDYMELLWCTRYGTNKNKKIREMNPLSCYECKLRDKCQGYAKIKNEKVYYTKELTKKIEKDAIRNWCLFICLSHDNIPQKIYKKRHTIKKKTKSQYELIDEFSGYLIRDKIINEKIYNVNDFIEELPPFSFNNISIVSDIE